MAHHKRKRAKSRRAGCLMCKPHKSDKVANSKKSQKPSVQRKLQPDDE